MEFLEEYLRYMYPAIGFIILSGCVLSVFYKRPKNKTVAFLVNEKTGDAVAIKYWETSIGRSNSCDITLKYDTVSRAHAVISRRNNKWEIFDTGSKSGVYINGEKIKKKSVLENGDTITLGEAGYVFSAPDFNDSKEDKYISALISGNNGKVFLLEGESYIAGRGKDCDIYLNLPTVSRKHVQFNYLGGKWEITNFSSNGVYVGNKLYTKKKILKDGDVLDVGGAIIKFEEKYRRV